MRTSGYLLQMALVECATSEPLCYAAGRKSIQQFASASQRHHGEAKISMLNSAFDLPRRLPPSCVAGWCDSEDRIFSLAWCFFRKNTTTKMLRIEQSFTLKVHFLPPWPFPTDLAPRLRDNVSVVPFRRQLTRSSGEDAGAKDRVCSGLAGSAHFLRSSSFAGS